MPTLAHVRFLSLRSVRLFVVDVYLSLAINLHLPPFRQSRVYRARSTIVSFACMAKERRDELNGIAGERSINRRNGKGKASKSNPVYGTARHRQSHTNKQILLTAPTQKEGNKANTI